MGLLLPLFLFLLLLLLLPLFLFLLPLLLLLLLLLFLFRKASSASATVSASSSSSSSASTPNGPYQVFINHRGPDVKKSFASFLYRELKSRGLQVFLDQSELEPGHPFPSQIKAAIQSASVQIAIFSKTYAESKFCLEELVDMLETTRRDTKSQRATILPVFYEVKPSELRRTDRGAYANAMRKHKQRYNLETIEEWKKALFDVADISGFELEACNGDEVELVDKVVQRVLEKVPKAPLFVANYTIGLPEKIKDFERTTLSRLEGQNTLEAKVVGIVGLGGIGKSTLAKEFFNEKRSNYNGSSFLFDVRESAAQKVLHSWQKKLIKDLVGKDITIDSWEEGVGILANNLKSCEALIILDDVDHRYQLDAFLRVKSVLHPRSLILVTSRDKHVLQSVCTIESSIYHLKGLDRTNSLELFCWHAFFQSHPPPEFEDLVDGFLEACGGLPLSLQVFGALLCQERDRSCWEEQLNGLQKLPDDIQARLKISYDSLSEEEQQIFLDIACFSLGEDKDEWIKIWGWSGWKSSMGFRNLQNKCLVDVDEYNRIKMHDHLRDLGRSIAQDPSLPRRLWRATPKDVYDLLEQSSLSVIEVRGIIMAPRLTWKKESFSDHWVEESISDKVFRISRLQLLEGWEDFVERILTKVRSPNLRWLRWFDCPCSSLPSCIPMRELRFLEVRGKRLERLESEPPLQLRELHISAPLLEFPNSLCHLPDLQKISLIRCTFKALPNAFGTLTNLQKISLWRCKSLEALPDSIENLRNLQNINLRGCTSLEVLPNAIGALMNLQTIDLSGCVNLKRLPNFSEKLSNVHTISLSNCISFEALPDSIENLLQLRHLHLGCCSRLILSNETLGNITTLKCLDLSGCLQIEVLPLQVLQQWSLKRLNLLSTNIRELPSAPIVCLKNLEVLILGSPQLKVLPPWLGSLENLKDLLLHGCRKLKCLPDSIGQCSQMRNMEISKCGIQYLPDSVMQLNKLEILRVRGCPLRELPFKKKVEGQGEPSVELTETSQGRELDSSSDRSMNGLREIHLYLTEISEVSFPAGVCPNLAELKIRWCNDLVEVGALPTTLKHLDLRGCGALRKVGGLCGLAQLERLDIRGCCALEVEELPCLETVISMDTLRPILRSLKILKTPLETYDPDEKEEEQMTTAALDSGRLSALRLCWKEY